METGKSFGQQMEELAVLTVIASYYIRERVARIAAWHDTLGISLCLGRGTVKRTIPKSSGMSDMRKGLVTILCTRENAREILQDLKSELHLDEPNTGIAFLGQAFMEKPPAITHDPAGRAAANDRPFSKGSANEAGSASHAVYVIVDQGFAEDVILEAERAGIQGATVIPAYTRGSSDSRSIRGLTSIQEREIVLMVTTPEKAAGIFQSIQANRAIVQTARGVIFIIEIEETLGIRFY